MSVHSDGHSESSRETKVGKFDISRCIKQKILWFQVAVQDTMTMTEENALQQLVNVALTVQQTRIDQSINARFVGRHYTTHPGAPAIVSCKHDQQVHSCVVSGMYSYQ